MVNPARRGGGIVLGVESQSVGVEERGAGTNGARSASIRRCAAGSAIEILQEKWVLHIVHALLNGSRCFNELGRDVGGCNPTTLAHRLARLESVGVIRKEVLHDDGHAAGLPRCSYELTEAGRQLQDVIDAIRVWAVAHLVVAGELEAGGAGGNDRFLEAGAGRP